MDYESGFYTWFAMNCKRQRVDGVGDKDVENECSSQETTNIKLSSAAECVSPVTIPLSPTSSASPEYPDSAASTTSPASPEYPESAVSAYSPAPLEYLDFEASAPSPASTECPDLAASSMSTPSSASPYSPPSVESSAYSPISQYLPSYADSIQCLCATPSPDSPPTFSPDSPPTSSPFSPDSQTPSPPSPDSPPTSPPSPDSPPISPPSPDSPPPSPPSPDSSPLSSPHPDLLPPLVPPPLSTLSTPSPPPLPPSPPSPPPLPPYPDSPPPLPPYPPSPQALPISALALSSQLSLEPAYSTSYYTLPPPPDSTVLFTTPTSQDLVFPSVFQSTIPLGFQHKSAVLPLFAPYDAAPSSPPSLPLISTSIPALSLRILLERPHSTLFHYLPQPSESTAHFTPPTSLGLDLPSVFQATVSLDFQPQPPVFPVLAPYDSTRPSPPSLQTFPTSTPALASQLTLKPQYSTLYHYLPSSFDSNTHFTSLTSMGLNVPSVFQATVCLDFQSKPGVVPVHAPYDTTPPSPLSSQPLPASVCAISSRISLQPPHLTSYNDLPPLSDSTAHFTLPTSSCLAVPSLFQATVCLDFQPASDMFPVHAPCDAAPPFPSSPQPLPASKPALSSWLSLEPPHSTSYFDLPPPFDSTAHFTSPPSLSLALPSVFQATVALDFKPVSPAVLPVLAPHDTAMVKTRVRANRIIVKARKKKRKKRKST